QADPGGWAAFSADAQFLAAPGEENTVYLWKTATGKRCFRLRGHAARVEGLAFSADGKRLASAGLEGVRVWDRGTGRELRTFPHLRGSTGCLALSADGGSLAAPGCGYAVRIWDVATGAERVPALGHMSPSLTFAFTPDGRTLNSFGEDGLV